MHLNSAKESSEDSLLQHILSSFHFNTYSVTAKINLSLELGLFVCEYMKTHLKTFQSNQIRYSNQYSPSLEHR